MNRSQPKTEAAGGYFIHPWQAMQARSPQICLNIPIPSDYFFDENSSRAPPISATPPMMGGKET